jgi:hypothetical protein
MQINVAAPAVVGPRTEQAHGAIRAEVPFGAMLDRSDFMLFKTYLFRLSFPNMGLLSPDSEPPQTRAPASPSLLAKCSFVP